MPAFNNNQIFDSSADARSGFQPERIDEVGVACDGFELRVNNLLDDRADLSSDRLLQSHASDCVSCQQILQRYQQLELVLGSERKDPTDDLLVSRRDADVRPAIPTWPKLPVTALLAVAVLIIGGQYFGGTSNVVFDPSVAVAKVEPQVESTDDLGVPAGSLLADADVFWTPQNSVRKLKGLVDSGGDLLAAGEEQVAVIRGLSEVRLDLDVLEDRLQSLQPVLTYSGRIPALSPMQGTVCFTLGWLRQGKSEGQPEMQPESGSEAEVGMRSLRLRLRNLA